MGHGKSPDLKKITSHEAEILLSECGFGLDTSILVLPEAKKLRRPRNSHYQCNGKAQNYTEEVVPDKAIDRTRGNKTGNSGECFSETNQALLKSWWNLSSKKEKRDSTFLVGLVPPTGISREHVKVNIDMRSLKKTVIHAFAVEKPTTNQKVQVVSAQNFHNIYHYVTTSLGMKETKN